MQNKVTLKQAEFIQQGDHGKYLGDNCHCGFLACDHSKLVINPATNKKDRFCMKLQIFVSDYDGCKYHSHKKMSSLLSVFIDNPL